MHGSDTIIFVSLSGFDWESQTFDEAGKRRAFKAAQTFWGLKKKGFIPTIVFGLMDPVNERYQHHLETAGTVMVGILRGHHHVENRFMRRVERVWGPLEELTLAFRVHQELQAKSGWDVPTHFVLNWEEAPKVWVLKELLWPPELITFHLVFHHHTNRWWPLCRVVLESIKTPLYYWRARKALRSRAKSK